MAVSPKEVFDDPDKFWGLLTTRSDQDFEGQFFDRKEAGRPEPHGAVAKRTLDDVMEEIAGCVSAFANKNVQGGLLVVGISSAGEVKGIDHLNEDQQNRLTNIAALLRNQTAQIKVHNCVDAAGASKQICLVFVPFCPNAMCETTGNSPKAWTRNGKQNLILDQGQRDQIMRDKPTSAPVAPRYI
jgi:hypothetical protein